MKKEYYSGKIRYQLLKDIQERVKTIDTKVEYLIESLSDMRQYYRVEDLWEKDNLG